MDFFFKEGRSNNCSNGILLIFFPKIKKEKAGIYWVTKCVLLSI